MYIDQIRASLTDRRLISRVTRSTNLLLPTYYYLERLFFFWSSDATCKPQLSDGVATFRLSLLEQDMLRCGITRVVNKVTVSKREENLVIFFLFIVIQVLLVYFRYFSKISSYYLLKRLLLNLEKFFTCFELKKEKKLIFTYLCKYMILSFIIPSRISNNYTYIYS